MPPMPMPPQAGPPGAPPMPPPGGPPGPPPPMPPGGATGGGHVPAAAVLPPNHQLGMVVPRGGSMCGNCKYLAGPQACGNPGYAKWNGSPQFPAPADQYCCDLYESRGMAPSGPQMPPGAGPQGPQPPQGPPGSPPQGPSAGGPQAMIKALQG